MASGESGSKLSELIKKAIRDCEVTTTEYDKILALANEDGVVDELEKSQLKQLQDLLANNTIKRVPG